MKLLDPRTPERTREGKNQSDLMPDLVTFFPSSSNCPSYLCGGVLPRNWYAAAVACSRSMLQICSVGGELFHSRPQLFRVHIFYLFTKILKSLDYFDRLSSSKISANKLYYCYTRTKVSYRVN